MSDNTRIARAVFDAFEGNDIEAARRLCADSFKGIQNGVPRFDREAMMGFLAAVHAKLDDFRYDNIVCSATPDGFVEEHDIKATLPDGEAFSMRLCVVGKVTDGQVTELREYVDTAQAAGLAKALAG